MITSKVALYSNRVFPKIIIWHWDCQKLLMTFVDTREALYQVSNGSYIEMASKSHIFEFLHHSLKFGAFLIVLICNADFVGAVLWLVQQNELYKSKQ